jgi:hypothetical protein
MVTDNTSWVNKMTIECIDEVDGGMSIRFDWDETDPELAMWTGWGEEGQKAFVLDVLHRATEYYLG